MKLIQKILRGYFLNKNIFLINEKKLKQALLENSSLKFFEIKRFIQIQ